MQKIVLFVVLMFSNLLFLCQNDIPDEAGFQSPKSPNSVTFYGINRSDSTDYLGIYKYTPKKENNSFDCCLFVGRLMNYFLEESDSESVKNLKKIKYQKSKIE